MICVFIYCILLKILKVQPSKYNDNETTQKEIWYYLENKVKIIKQIKDKIHEKHKVQAESDLSIDTTANPNLSRR